MGKLDKAISKAIKEVERLLAERPQDHGCDFGGIAPCPECDFDNAVRHLIRMVLENE